MLLEGLDATELGELLASEATRDEYVSEALAVLQEAGDERAERALAAPMPAPQAAAVLRPALEVDIGAAQAASDAAGTQSGLTPALAGFGLRASPRVSRCAHHASSPRAALATRCHATPRLASPRNATHHIASHRLASRSKYHTSNILAAATLGSATA